MIPSPAAQLLETGTVVLSEYRETRRQFFGKLLKYLFLAPLLWWLAIAFIAVFSVDPLYWFFHPLPFTVIYAFLVINAWRSLGERRVVVDVQRQALLFEEHWPNRKNAPASKTEPFANLLLVRHWVAESDTGSAAFVLRLQVGKQIDYPPLDGYFLHAEFADNEAAKAESVTAAMADRLVAATGIAYFDVQHSGEARLAQWINTALLRSELASHAGHGMRAAQD